MSHGADPVKSILYALAANGGIAIAKYGAAFTTGSGAMLAEAIHSTADCGNQGLLLWGLKSAKSAPSPDYPLGYGKAIYFWSFIVALMLFTVGGLYSLYEGIHKMHDPGELKKPWIAVGILTFSILLEAASTVGCLKEINKTRGNKNLWQWCKETRQSELVVVLGEDVAALGGLVLALGAILLAIFTNNPIYDAYGTIVIGALLLIVAAFIAVKIKGLLIGQSVEPELREEIKNFVESDESVVELLSSVTQQMGNDVMLAIKARMKPCDSGRELVKNINDCEKRIKVNFPTVKWIFFEPDIED
jgi:cation diffusion facilitator family transporter